jgi:hypothetical protein
LTDLHLFNLFSLDGKLFATSKFSVKNIFKRKLLLLSLLRIIWFFSDRLFLIYKSSFEKQSVCTKMRVCYPRCLNKKKYISFLLIRSREKWSRTPVKKNLNLFLYDFNVKIENSNFFKKDQKNEILAHRKKYFFS